jgi:hypothetical protein
MFTDFFTKPLQGSLFRRLRAIIMGHQHVDTLKEFTLAATQERVGTDVIETVKIGFVDSVSTTDTGSPGPVVCETVQSVKSASYAQVLMRKSGKSVLESEREKLLLLTLKK